MKLIFAYLFTIFISLVIVNTTIATNKQNEIKKNPETVLALLQDSSKEIQNITIL